MSLIPPSSLRPARLLGLLTPLAVMVALVALLLVPNLIMHTGLYSNANSTGSPPGQDAPSQSAAAAVESPPVMR
jgi:predicted cobalt transporter CbtA